MRKDLPAGKGREERAEKRDLIFSQIEYYASKVAEIYAIIRFFVSILSSLLSALIFVWFQIYLLNTMIEKAIIYTKFGKFELTGSEKGIQRVRKAEDFHRITEDVPKVLQKCAQQLNAYFAGRLKEFDLALDWSGASEFHIKVWEVLLQVPYGHTISYGAIAKLINNPQAYQAVGLANKYNPIPIIVPCHRCIGKDGDLTGYNSGLEMKQALLQLENPMSFAKQGSLF